jgi:Putative DnaT-like ssDNA binding protein
VGVIVEDGTGLANAQSYLSVADADLYFAEHSNPTAWTSALTPAKEQALKLATQYMDAVFKMRWKGIRKLETQALDWPRSGVNDRDGYWISQDIVPVPIKSACAEYAVRSLTNELFPDISVDSGPLTEKRVKVGPIEVEKHFGSGGTLLYRRYSLVEKLLTDMFRPSGMVRA